MNIYDLVTAEELQSVPDDPSQAFGYLARLSQVRYRERLSKIDISDPFSSFATNDIRVGFAKTLIGIAQAYDLNPFANSYSKIDDNGSDSNTDLSDELIKFERDLPVFLAKLEIHNIKTRNQNHIPISIISREKIRSHIDSIKILLDKTDISRKRKEHLYSYLLKFESEITKPKLNIADAGILFIRVLEITASMTVIADSESIRKITNAIVMEVSKASIEDKEDRLLTIDQPKLLLPPPEQPEAYLISDDSEIPF